MRRTDGWTDGRTDGQDGDYMLPRNFSGSIKTQWCAKLKTLFCDVVDNFYEQKSFINSYKASYPFDNIMNTWSMQVEGLVY